MPEINIPFPGFYESWLSQILDCEAERDAENRAEQESEQWPAELQLTESDISECQWRPLNYSIAQEHLARAYVEEFDALAGEALGESRAAWRNAWRNGAVVKERYRADSCGMVFSTMTSPREYNFETDRLFVDVSRAFIGRLWKMSKAEGHATLRRFIRDRFTSRSGFISHYRNRLEDWPADLADWDYNQLGTLLLACLDLSGFDDSAVMESMLSGETGYYAFEKGMDWAQFESDLTDKRIERLTAWAETDPESLARWAANHPDAFAALLAHDPEALQDVELPRSDACGAFYRCKATPDLFAAALA